MRPPIKDEFTHLKISRQRKHQLRRIRDGLCEICGEPRVGSASRCPKCLIKSREEQRARLGRKERYRGAMSYQIEKEIGSRRRRKTAKERRREEN